MTNKIGFACKFTHSNQNDTKKNIKLIESQYNTTTTTLAWLNRQSRDVAEQKLYDICVENAARTLNLVNYVASLPLNLRMLRISSDQCPVFTHPDWKGFYQDQELRSTLERKWAEVGQVARANDVRLSFHPGQFCVLASDSESIVNNSIDEFEYHVELAKWMGYAKTFQDFKINVHLSGKGGVEQFRKTHARLSPEARNTITIENDEYSSGLDKVLEISDIVPIVFDNHHHFINSDGEHLTPDDARYSKVLESWRGVRPVMHYSVSREEYAGDANVLPCMNEYISKGYKKGKLRAHSDYYYNRALNDLILEFWKYTDIMCESKAKNLASIKLWEYANGHF